MKALYQKALPDGRVRCDLCPHHCALAEGEDGLCLTRGAREGALRALGYGRVSSAALDPVEKKPLYHFHPGRFIFSIGGWGCNFACPFCQNWHISQQTERDSRLVSPEEVVRKAGRNDSVGIAYTYNEPLVGYEFVQDCARLAEAAGLANVLVTNGFIEEEPARALLPRIRALNVDIKSIDPEFYRRHCRGRLEPVLRFCVLAREAGCHVEITNLVIPGLNDGPGAFEGLAQWIRDHLGPATPLHLSAYHPDFRMEIPPTSAATLLAARQACAQCLPYVYVGNILAREGQSTDCPQCGREWIARRGYSVRVTGLRDGACAQCGRKADGVGL